MPPVVLEMFGAILRVVIAAMLHPLFHWLANHGYVPDPGQVTDVLTWLSGVVGLALWACWRVWGAKLRQVVAQAMPHGSTEAEVRAVITESKLVGAPLPSVLTPENVKVPEIAPMPAAQAYPLAIPKNPPPAACWLLAAALGLGMLTALGTPACAPMPPAGTYTAPVSREYQATPLQQSILALSRSAIAANAAAGSLHLSDGDTAQVRDFAITASGSVDDWVQGVGTLANVRSALSALTRKLSDKGRLQTLNAVLGAVSLALTNLGI